MLKIMATLKAELPAHCRVVNRGSYADVYFKVHPKDRPDGWKPSIPLGRTDQDSFDTILEKAKKVSDEYEAFLMGVTTIKTGSLPDLITKFKKSELWHSWKPANQKEYHYYFETIREWSEKAGHAHVSLMTVKSINKWLSGFSETPSRRKRLLLSLKRLLDLAVNEGEIESNPAKKITLPPVGKPKRLKKLWSEKEIDAFVSACDAAGRTSLGTIALTMIESAQRLSDVVFMVYGRDYKDGHLHYIQSKTGKSVWLPCTEKLKARYKAYPPHGIAMFINECTGKQWTVSNVSHVARKILDEIGMEGYILKELRNSQTTYLLELGCEIPEMAAMTGHSLQTAQKMFDQHYAETRSKILAEKVVKRIDDFRKSNTKSNTRGNTNDSRN
jgi:integrase